MKDRLRAVRLDTGFEDEDEELDDEEEEDEEMEADFEGVPQEQ